MYSDEYLFYATFNSLDEVQKFLDTNPNLLIQLIHINHSNPDNEPEEQTIEHKAAKLGINPELYRILQSLSNLDTVS